MINRHLIENFSVIFSYITKILNFFNVFNKLILLSQFTNSCLFTLESVRKPYRPLLLFNISLKRTKFLRIDDILREKSFFFKGMSIDAFPLCFSFNIDKFLSWL